MPSLTADLDWLKSHVVTVALLAALTYGGVYEIESLIAKHDAQQSAQQALIVQQMTAANQQLQLSIKTQMDAIAAQNAQLAQQNSILLSALAQRQATEKKLPQVNQNLSAAEAAKTLGGTVDGDNVVLDLPIARNIVTDVQLVPLLQQDKADLEKSNELLATEVSNGEQALSLERKSHQSDNDTNAATIKGLKDDIATIKSDCRKSKLKWFGIGYVAGFISGVIVHAGV